MNDFLLWMIVHVNKFHVPNFIFVDTFYFKLYKKDDNLNTITHATGLILLNDKYNIKYKENKVLLQ